MVWNADYCKGCMICVNECPANCLEPVNELEFPDGVVRLEKPF
jgi:Pyruvate/2-oxoacid:ferredoxin oxidoreductase delta subunit